jgi:UDP-N-acetylmuramyl tripeptide synthase
MPGSERKGRARAAVAVTLARFSGVLSRRLRVGGGTSLPGMVARRVDPTITGRLSRQLARGSIVVTATNGKTTTCGLTAAILRQAGLRVWRNREGSNLINGIAAALIIRANLNGRLRRGENTIAIFEVDEAAFPAVVREVQPRAILINNLFRDQLDRYGEVETVARRWRETLAEISPETILVLNADDPSIAALSASFRGKTLFYGINDPRPAIAAEGKAGEQGQTIDARTCPHCGADLEYSLRFYSHIGHYRCPSCGQQRPQPALIATAVSKEQFDRQRVTISGAGETGQALIALPGFYNVYNALAAATVATGLGIDFRAILAGLERFRPAFGRGETIEAEGRTVRLMLAKNPTGFTEVLRTLFTENPTRHLLLALNDNAADGRDISWIWDVDFEQLTGKDLALTISGTRADDLAVRLKYAGVSGMVEGNLPTAIFRAIDETPQGETLYIVPTYTAMLAVRGELERRGYTAHYWEGQDA